MLAGEARGVGGKDETPLGQLQGEPPHRAAATAPPLSAGEGRTVTVHPEPEGERGRKREREKGREREGERKSKIRGRGWWESVKKAKNLWSYMTRCTAVNHMELTPPTSSL